MTGGNVVDFSNITSIVGFAFVGVLGICTFLIRSLISRMEEGNKTLISLDKNLAVLIARIDNYDSRLATLEHQLELGEADREDLRKRLNELSDIMSKVKWNCKQVCNAD